MKQNRKIVGVVLSLLMIGAPQIAKADPEIIGKCLGFIGSELEKKGGIQNIAPSLQKYFTSNEQTYALIQRLGSSHSSCFAPDNDIAACLAVRRVNKYTITLLQSFISGMVTARDPKTHAALSVDCQN